MDGVGEEYEWPKKRQGWWMVQLLLARCRIPVRLGNVVIRFTSQWHVVVMGGRKVGQWAWSQRGSGRGLGLGGLRGQSQKV
jgi:hypothetical protein